MNGNLLSIAAKMMDVVAHPLYSSPLITETCVFAVFLSQGIRLSETKD